MYNYTVFTENKDKQRSLSNNLASSLKTILAILDLNYNDLASMIGVSRQSISLYTTGRTPMPYSSYIAITVVLEYYVDNNLQNGITIAALNTIFEEINK